MNAPRRPQQTIEIDDDLSRLVERLRAHAHDERRFMLGIVGAPGVGKSTVADALARELGAPLAIAVPLDGFHLASAALTAPGQKERRGAIDTFDVGGYLSLITRLRGRDEPVVYAPGFERSLEEPIAGLIAIPREIPVVITEGNYLLSPQPGWRDIRPLLDETWFLDGDPVVRRERLIARHIRFGKTPEHARAMTDGSDEANARTIAERRAAADVVVRFTGTR